MKLKSLYIFLFLFLSHPLLAQNKIISGAVFDDENKPLPYVNVFIMQSTDGAMTNENGEFRFITKKNSKILLVASIVGYKQYKGRFVLTGKNKLENIRIILTQKAVKLKEAIVMGSSFSSVKGKGIVLSSMDVITTPGGAADIYQSLKTLPGLTQVSESAQLYVRGGDPSETVTLIDQAAVNHPYTLESSYGGLFSNLKTGSVKGMYFSSGGFSVKYGNVLSGVLDVETKDEPISSNYSLGVSMAALSLEAETNLIDNKLGFRFILDKSFTKPIMWMNGSLDEFTSTPDSKSITSSLIYKYSQTGRIKLLGLFAEDNQGVKVNRAEYTGSFNGKSSNNLLTLQLTDILFDNILIKSNVSINNFNNNWNIGSLDLAINDYVIQSRTDIQKTFTQNFSLSAGFEIESRAQKYVGSVPADDFDLRPDSKIIILNDRTERVRFGTYLELKQLSPFGLKNLFLIAGYRKDFIPKLKSNWNDIRGTIGYKVGNKSSFNFGFGIFHQIPDGRFFSRKDGNPNLKPMKALHYILSYNYFADENNSIRIELYRKKYAGLPLEDKNINYNNNGFGFANGIDLILKGKLFNSIKGWISYGYINTKRKWLDFENLTNSSFDITHNLSIVAKYNFSSAWQIGINFKLATGRPYTPIINSIYRSADNYYEPVLGKNLSSRYPTYKRLDLRITHLNQLFNNYFTIFYIEGINILNFSNLFDYTYNKDYSTKTEIKSYFGRRTIVVGMQIDL